MSERLRRALKELSEALEETTWDVVTSPRADRPSLVASILPRPPPRVGALFLSGVGVAAHEVDPLPKLTGPAAAARALAVEDCPLPRPCAVDEWFGHFG